MRLLVTYANNWADEINVFGFAILQESTSEFLKSNWDSIVEKTKHVKFTHAVGSNQICKYDMRNLDIHEVTDDEVHFISGLFGERYGLYPYFIDDILGWASENDWDLFKQLRTAIDNDFATRYTNG